MNRWREIWQQRLWVWLPAAIFFAANLLVLLVYQFGYGDRVATLQDELKEQRTQTKAALEERRHLEDLVRQAVVTRQRLEHLYTDSFATRKSRLTGVTAEVESLAGKAGLKPKTFNFPEQEIASYGLVKLSFQFSVSGTYLELRQFINMLELSDSFLTLERVSITKGNQDDGKHGRVAAVATPRLQANPRLVPGLPPLPAPPAAIINNSPELSLSLTLSTLFSRNAHNLDTPPPASNRRGA